MAGIGNIGLAQCRLEMMTDITLTGEGTQFSPDQEFKVSWTGEEEGSNGSGEVKVKALLPPWTRDFINSSGSRNNNNNRRNEDIEGSRAKRIVEQLEEEETERRND